MAAKSPGPYQRGAALFMMSDLVPGILLPLLPEQPNISGLAQKTRMSIRHIIYGYTAFALKSRLLPGRTPAAFLHYLKFFL